MAESDRAPGWVVFLRDLASGRVAEPPPAAGGGHNGGFVVPPIIRKSALDGRETSKRERRAARG